MLKEGEKNTQLATREALIALHRPAGNPGCLGEEGGFNRIYLLANRRPCIKEALTLRLGFINSGDFLLTQRFYFSNSSSGLSCFSLTQG